MSELTLALILASMRLLPLALMLPIPAQAPIWALRVSVAATLVPLGALLMLPELGNISITHQLIVPLLIREASIGLALAMSASLLLPAGALCGAVFDTLIPEWRTSRPFFRLFDTLLIVLALALLLHLDGIEWLLLSYRLAPVEAALEPAAVLSNALLRGGALFALVFAATLPILLAFALVELVLAIATKLAQWPASGPSFVRPALLLVLIIGALLRLSQTLLRFFAEA